MSRPTAAEAYPTIIKKVGNLAGLSLEAARSGQTSVKILNRAFLTSFNLQESSMLSSIVSPFGVTSSSNLNQLLVTIRDETAHIYQNFPLTLQCRTKESVQAFQAVFLKQVADITEVKFEDSIFNLDVQDNDKFLWLFREQWHFGCYFDFTGQLRAADLPRILGTHYRTLLYYDTYLTLSSQGQFDTLKKRGWFPFIQITGKHFDALSRSLNDKSQLEIVEESIVSEFHTDAINKIVSYWWDVPLFKDKKKLLMAGIEAYLDRTDSGAINSIKTLSSEIEGIMRLDYFKTYGKDPKIRDLCDHISKLGTIKFSSEGSLGFPDLFYEYLNEVIFKNFDLKTGSVDLSRHTTSHGVAGENLYNQVRALQLIFTLDQMYFYMK